MNLRFEQLVARQSGHVELKEGEGIVVGMDSELAVSIHLEKNELVITGPINVNAKSFAISRNGVREI